MNRPISQWAIDGKFPSIPESLEFRREQYGWTKKEMSKELGIGYTHYIEVLNGRRQLSLKGIRRAYDIGVPGKVLLQKIGV